MELSRTVVGDLDSFVISAFRCSARVEGVDQFACKPIDVVPDTLWGLEIVLAPGRVDLVDENILVARLLEAQLFHHSRFDHVANTVIVIVLVGILHDFVSIRAFPPT